MAVQEFLAPVPSQKFEEIFRSQELKIPDEEFQYLSEAHK